MNAIALTFQSTQFDIVDRNCHPWLRGYQIGTALGYTQGSQAISKLFDRNSDEFTDTMTALVELDTEGGKQQVRIFSLRGCHLLAMLSRTKIAKEFRKWVLDILDNQLSSNPVQLEPPTITKAQQGILFNLVGGKSDHSGKGRSYYWSRFASHFKLSSYKDLPIDKFDEAHQYLQGLEGEEMLYLTVKELSRIVDEQIKKSIEGELLSKPEIHHHNSITINLAPLVDHQMRRWLVTQALNEMTVLEALNSNQVVKTREQFIQELICDGYLVMKKEDILGRLQA